MNVLFCTTEITPFSSVGGLSEFSKHLPKALGKLGVDISVITPFYRNLEPSSELIEPYAEYPEAELLLANQPYKVNYYITHLPNSDIPVYFVDCDAFFARDGIYNNPGDNKGFADNDKRFALFQEAILHLIVVGKIRPDIMHLNDHLTSLIPSMLKSRVETTPEFASIKTILTIHNVEYQQDSKDSLAYHLGINEILFEQNGYAEQNGKLNFLKAGIMTADKVITVSQSYANETKSDNELGHDLSDVLSSRGDDYFGILNGIDYAEWNPKSDALIKSRYSVSNLAGKKKSKKELLAQNGLDYSNLDIPTIGMISSLTDRKGFDLLVQIFEKMMTFELNIVMLGSGEARYHKLFESIMMRFPHKLGLNLIHSDKMAHSIFAGSDFFLMPSRYEPCGVHQMIAMRYGSVPIIRATGGLADTVENVSDDGKSGWGFTFPEYDSMMLLKTVWRAVSMYKNKSSFKKIIQRNIRLDYSWDKSASQYLEVYKNLAG